MSIKSGIPTKHYFDFMGRTWSIGEQQMAELKRTIQETGVVPDITAKPYCATIVRRVPKPARYTGRFHGRIEPDQRRHSER